MLLAARSEDWKEMFQNAMSLSSETRKQSQSLRLLWPVEISRMPLTQQSQRGLSTAQVLTRKNLLSSKMKQSWSPAFWSLIEVTAWMKSNGCNTIQACLEEAHYQLKTCLLIEQHLQVLAQLPTFNLSVLLGHKQPLHTHKINLICSWTK